VILHVAEGTGTPASFVLCPLTSQTAPPVMSASLALRVPSLRVPCASSASPDLVCWLCTGALRPQRARRRTHQHFRISTSRSRTAPKTPCASLVFRCNMHKSHIMRVYVQKYLDHLMHGIRYYGQRGHTTSLTWGPPSVQPFMSAYSRRLHASTCRLTAAQSLPRGRCTSPLTTASHACVVEEYVRSQGRGQRMRRMGSDVNSQGTAAPSQSMPCMSFTRKTCDEGKAENA
jgi:hypothetical protein